MNERELEDEAKKLGWTIEYLKKHLAKEERIKKMFDELKEREIIRKDNKYKIQKS